MEDEKREQICLAFYPRVLGYLSGRLESPQDAEDLAQTVFLKIFSRLEQYDEGRSALSTWIFRITRNTLIDHQRAMAFRRHEELPEVLVGESEDILAGLVLEEQLEQLAEALEQLPPEERDLIILHYYSGHTLLALAERMGRPYGQIKRLHQRALQKLRWYMRAGPGTA